jgi:hypothetical protein
MKLMPMRIVAIALVMSQGRREARAVGEVGEIEGRDAGGAMREGGEEGGAGREGGVVGETTLRVRRGG